MKRTLLLLALIAFGFFVHAQSYDAAKNLLAIGQVKKAKEELDKGMTNAKYASKPEAYMLKMAIYANLAQDNEFKGTPAGEALLAEAESAFIKYKELQPELTLMKEPIYQN